MIVRKRSVQGGQPVLDGTRMPVASVRAMYHHGGYEYVRDQYPHLTPAQIEAALGHGLRYRLLQLVDLLDTPVEFRVWQAVGGVLLAFFMVKGLVAWLS